jgi:hypothetical protein
LLANRRRGKLLPLCRRLLAVQPVPIQTKSTDAPAPDLCPVCQGPMRTVERLSADQLQRERHLLAERLDSS